MIGLVRTRGITPRVIEHAGGHHLPAGYCDLLLELSGAYTSDESSDALAALRARVIASDWARPADHRAVLT